MSCRAEEPDFSLRATDFPHKRKTQDARRKSIGGLFVYEVENSQVAIKRYSTGLR